NEECRECLPPSLPALVAELPALGPRRACRPPGTQAAVVHRRRPGSQVLMRRSRGRSKLLVGARTYGPTHAPIESARALTSLCLQAMRYGQLEHGPAHRDLGDHGIDSLPVWRGRMPFHVVPL